MGHAIINRKEHWETIYSNKKMEEVSWYQAVPRVSLDLFQKNNVSKDASILDVGGGDSFLVDHLLELGYENLTVLDISAKAVERAQKRLGKHAERVRWIVSDIVDFQPEKTFDVWHDRAVFHFLTETEEINKYQSLVNRSLNKNGLFFIGTFSIDGPTKCSGIGIQQYSEETIEATFGLELQARETFRQEHETPFNTTQEFLFGVFQKNKL